MTSIAEAITRVKIVRDAVDGVEGDNPLAQVESYTSVMEFLEVVLDTYEDPDTDRERLIYALTLNVLTWAAALPPLGLFPRVASLAFDTFANSIELLLDVLDEEDE